MGDESGGETFESWPRGGPSPQRARRRQARMGLFLTDPQETRNRTGRNGGKVTRKQTKMSLL